MTETISDFDVSPEIREERIITLWSEGLSLREIGLKIGKSHAYVRSVLRGQGIDTSSRRGKDTSERDRRIVEVYTNSDEPTIQEVAEDFGLSYNTVQGILSSAGVTRQRGRPASEDPKRNRQVISYRPDGDTLQRIKAVAEMDRISLDEVVHRQVLRAIREGYL